MLSISLLFIVELFNMIAGKRNEIGHIPMKGNLWRAKQYTEISPNVSVEFAAFAKHCKTTTSEDTGIIYHYSPNGTVYPLAEDDQTICAYSLERTVPNEIDAPDISNFTLYFVCDDTCCAMECCQRDVQMTIIGAILIGISLCILGCYICVYFGGLICAWTNGAFGQRHTNWVVSTLNHIVEYLLLRLITQNPLTPVSYMRDVDRRAQAVPKNG